MDMAAQDNKEVARVPPAISSIERRMLGDIMGAEATVMAEVLTGEITSPKRMHETLVAACNVLHRIDNVRAKIRPIIGRLLDMIQLNPEAYTKLGHRTFEEYLQKEVIAKLGVSRTDCFEAKRITRAFPEMSIDIQASVGSVKMSLLARVANQNSKNLPMLLEKAKNLSIEGFSTYLEEKHLLDPTEDGLTEVTLLISKGVAKQLSQFLNDPRVIAKVGSPNKTTIVEMMIGELSGEWLG